VFDLLAQMWLSATRRALTYFIAIASLGLGVAAFVCLGALSESFTDSLTHRIRDPQSDWESPAAPLAVGPTISVEVGREERPLDAKWVDEQVRRTLAREVGVMATGSYDLKVGRHALSEWPVAVVSSHWLELRPHFWEMHYTIAGRLLTPEDDRSGEAVCIIDHRLARALGENADPVGQTVKVDGRPFRVVGVVRGGGYSPGGCDGLLLISFSAAHPLLRIQPPDGLSFVVRCDETGVESEMNSVQTAVSRALGRDHRVSVGSPWLELNRTRQQISYMRLLLGGISLLPLVVGLLGMVSMLLANLNSRVREIGVHRALGATRSRQAILVFCEAGVTGLLAGLVGIAAGTAVLHLLASAWGAELHTAPGWVTAALLAGLTTALLAGIIPARAAIRISPCEALRAE
jgi:ABC-type antimicrobial peptide transport system permease subunit